MSTIDPKYRRFVNTTMDSPSARPLWTNIELHQKPNVWQLMLARQALAAAGANRTVRIGTVGVPATTVKAFLDQYLPAVPQVPAANPLFGVDWLGYGYKPFGFTLDANACSRGPLFNYPEWTDYQYNNKTYSMPKVVDVLATQGQSTLLKIDQSSVKDTLNQFYTKICGGLDWGLFKAEVEFGYAKAIECHWEYRTSTIVMQTRLLRLTFKDLAAMRALLTQEAAADLEKVTHGQLAPVAFFDNWGTHYISGIYVGGQYALYMRFKKRAYKRTIDIDAKTGGAYAGIQASNQTRINTVLNEMAQSQELQMSSYGGMAMPTDWAELAMQAWQDRVVANPGPMAFYVDGQGVQGLTPIYTLVADPQRQNALKDQFTAYCNMPGRKINLPGIGTAVSSLNVTAHADRTTAQRNARVGGYELIDRDLNEGARGDWIYLAKKFADNAESPILNLQLIHSNSSNMNAPAGYQKYNVDLNKGAGGEYIYLCSTTDAQGNPLAQPVRDVFVESYDDERTTECFTDRGYDPVTEPGLGMPPLDCNRGARGKYIYIMMSR